MRNIKSKEESAEVRRLRSTKRRQDLQKLVMVEHRYICFLCHEIADEVHHKEPATIENFFIRENLVPLCLKCHDKVEAAYNIGATWKGLTHAGRKRPLRREQ